MNLTPDHQARETALNPAYSFIVQAPAGSGKTELLVQRFLVLLAQAQRAPEEIIAITFTRKAASEMRQRVLDALNAAQKPAPDQPHALKTWELGCAVLKRDQQSNWNLLENPNRLRIQTIDSLCHSIAHRAPLLSGLGVSNQLLERDIEQCYLEATRRLLNGLEEDSPLAEQLSLLLLHLDNRVEMVEKLLVRMLARRDQWLPHLISHGRSLSAVEFRQLLEAGLLHTLEDILMQCDAALPKEHHQVLLTLMCFAAEHYPEVQNSIFKDLDLEKFPQPLPENYACWLFLAGMLLTKEGLWRAQIDKRYGFPADKDKKPMKEYWKSLMESLRGNDILHQRLAAILTAPPTAYSDTQWKIIQTLSAMLPLLVAELKVLFKEKNVADFSEVTMAAHAALGDKEYPTDLSLILDTQIQHLLVDEFQDTSITQFHLLEKLTAGWQPDDGRTLFLVGDPMQSIYRFREAEVGLFLKAQQEGLGSVKLQPLTLQANFRSTPEILSWINTNFPTIFPAQSDISTGAVHFSPCIATKPSDKNSSVFLGQNSTQKIVDVITQHQTEHPEQTIAILVRSRSHLYDIIPALKRANLAFTAVEIDPLAKQSVVQDLLSLTGALFHLGDRLSWLAILRAPWCGLTLHDLHALTDKHSKKILWESLDNFEEIKNLSADAKQRLHFIVPILKKSLAQRGRVTLRNWIEQTWLALRGPKCITEQNEFVSADAYFKLLETFDQTGETPEISVLQKAVLKQYVTPPAAENIHLHLMTIHKAKGLEFDTIIVPNLEQRGRSDEEQLLLWLDRPRAAHTNDLILAPIKAKDQKEDAIYAWLREVEKEKSQQELIRLLYVATTRAKKNLYLLARLPVITNEKKILAPTAGSFLNLLWPAFEKIAVAQDSIDNAAEVPVEPMRLKRLKSSLFIQKIVEEPIC